MEHHDKKPVQQIAITNLCIFIYFCHLHHNTLPTIILEVYKLEHLPKYIEVSLLYLQYMYVHCSSIMLVDLLFLLVFNMSIPYSLADCSSRTFIRHI